MLHLSLILSLINPAKLLGSQAICEFLPRSLYL